MTLENSKRRYLHYVESGQTERAEEVLTRYPELAEKKEEKKEVKKSTKE